MRQYVSPPLVEGGAGGGRGREKDVAHLLHCLHPMKLRILILAIIISGCGGLPPIALPAPSPSAAAAGVVAAPGGILTIAILDVGQGDATLVTTPAGHRILIDAGPAGRGKSVVLPHIIDSGPASLAHLMASHYDADHIGGVAEVLAGLDGIRGTADDLKITGACWDRGEGSKQSGEFLVYLSATAHCRRMALPGDVLNFGDGVEIEVVAVNGTSRWGILAELAAADENDTSMVLLIRFGNFRYLTTGDLPGGGGDPPFTTVDLETPLAPLIGSVDILHLGHHGSKTASNLNFLQTLSPDAAIISVGDGNPHFHPHPSVLQRLRDLKIPVYQTERGHSVGTHDSHVANGHIVIESNGDGLEIKWN